jgi:hypothetical protein
MQPTPMGQHLEHAKQSVKHAAPLVYVKQQVAAVVVVPKPQQEQHVPKTLMAMLQTMMLVLLTNRNVTLMSVDRAQLLPIVKIRF